MSEMNAPTDSYGQSIILGLTDAVVFRQFVIDEFLNCQVRWSRICYLVSKLNLGCLKVGIFYF